MKENKTESKIIIQNGMTFFLSGAVFKTILEYKFNNPEIIKLATQLGEFTDDGYRYVNWQRTNK